MKYKKKISLSILALLFLISLLMGELIIAAIFAASLLILLYLD